MLNNPDITTHFVKLIYPERHGNLDVDFLFSKKRAKRLKIPLQDDPIAYRPLSRGKYNCEYLYLPVLNSSRFLNYVKQINLLRLAGFYPPLGLLGYSIEDYSSIDLLPIQHKLDEVKKYARYRLDEVVKGLINPAYPE